jgi:hypothetical protein
MGRMLIEAVSGANDATLVGAFSKRGGRPGAWTLAHSLGKWSNACGAFADGVL